MSCFLPQLSEQTGWCGGSVMDVWRHKQSLQHWLFTAVLLSELIRAEITALRSCREAVDKQAVTRDSKHHLKCLTGSNAWQWSEFYVRGVVQRPWGADWSSMCCSVKSSVWTGEGSGQNLVTPVLKLLSSHQKKTKHSKWKHWDVTKHLSYAVLCSKRRGKRKKER